jgi:hypothetical protein
MQKFISSYIMICKCGLPLFPHISRCYITKIPFYGVTQGLCVCSTFNGKFRLFLLLKRRQKIWTMWDPKISKQWLKNITICDVMLCGLAEVYQHFSGTYCLHPQDQKITTVSKQVSRKQSTLQPLQIKAVYSSETLENLYQNIWYHITVNTILCNQNFVWDKLN